MPTFSPRLSAMNVGDPGEGLCVFFYDSRYNFGAGGHGSALGYTNITTSPGFRNEAEVTTYNGIQGAQLGIGFDVKGEFSTTNGNKSGNYNTAGYSGTTVPSPNTICTRSGTVSGYKIINTTPNLSTFDPGITLHEYVTSVDDITFKSFRIWLRNESRQLRIEYKDPVTDKFTVLQTINLDDLGAWSYADSLSTINLPSSLKVGMAFSTSDAFCNCVLKNIAVYGDTILHTTNASLCSTKVFSSQSELA